MRSEQAPNIRVWSNTPTSTNFRTPMFSKEKVTRLFSLATVPLLSVLFTQACIVPEVTCEYTRTCPKKTNDASVEPTTTNIMDAALDAPLAVADANTSSLGSSESTWSDAAFDAGADRDADADIVTVPISCEAREDCNSQQPICHAVEQVCTQCDNDFDCRPIEGKPLCLIRALHEQDNECVQCREDADCTDSICVENECLKCNPKNDDGCTDNLPQCVVVDHAPVCVACDTNEHCSAELPVCANHECVLCTSEDATHCPAETPICVTNETQARCVGCRDDNDCLDMDVGATQVDGLCIDEQCTVCELGTNRSCTSTLPYCVALIPEGDGGVSLFAPSGATTGAVASEQYLAFEHQCVQCIDDQQDEQNPEQEDPDAPSKDVCGGLLQGCYNGSCVECTRDTHCESAEASTCDLTTHSCAGCSESDDCSHVAAAPECDVVNHVCVECTAGRDALCEGKVCQTVPVGSGQYTCTEQAKRSANICDECLSDAHCPNDSACVLETYEDAQSYRCLPIQGLWDQGNECGNLTTPPFVDSVTATSVDGLSGTFCKPRRTSCQGYADYGRGTVSNDSGLATCNTNADCGTPGVADGVCIPWTETTNRCTYECVSDDDCHEGCNSMTAVDESVQQVCSLAP